jgi:aldose sugar dehydrogenase
MKNFALAILLFLLSNTFLKAQFTLDSTIVDTSTVIRGIDVPWEIIWGPDGHIWMTERFGRISRVNPQTGQQQELHLLQDCHQQGESGTLGMALHPDFPSVPEVFVVYTYLSGSSILEKVVKLTFTGSSLSSPTIILDNIPGSNIHNGARLAFLPDKTLLICTGDANNTSLPQNKDALAGKILRMTSTGAIPADNPISNSPIYTWGHRNPQGLVVNNGKIYSSEHGTQTDDELNLIIKGRDYGWPFVEGFCDQPSEQTYCNDNNVAEPLVAWTPTTAPSGIAFYNHTAIPEFQNAVLVAVLKDKMITSVRLNANGDAVLSDKHYLANKFGRIRDICVGPEGEIYIATNGPSWNNTQPNTHSIIRLKRRGIEPTYIENTASNNSPTIFPNPSNGEITIKLHDNHQISSLEIIDSMGNTAYSGRLTDNESKITLRQLSSGIYFVKITNAETSYWKKIVIQP